MSSTEFISDEGMQNIYKQSFSVLIHRLHNVFYHVIRAFVDFLRLQLPLINSK